MLFRHSYLPRLLAVQKELSDIHIKDERFDEILNRQQEAIKYEQSYPEYPKESGWINIHDVEELAKRLRGMSHQISPPSAPIALSFSEKQVDTEKRLEFSRVVNAGAFSAGSNLFPFGIMITIQPKVPISEGFVVVEFDNQFSTAECDLIDSELVVGETKMIENKTLADYLRNRQQTSYTIGIGKTPLAPENPLHVVALGRVPLHTVKVTLFSN